MEEFLRNLQSPSWWAGTIVVGILVNLLTPFISRILESLSNSWADKRRKDREKKEKKQHDIAVAIRTSQIHMLLIVAHEQRDRSRALFWALFSCFCMGVSLYLVQIIVTLHAHPLRYAASLTGGVFSAFSGFCASFAFGALGKAKISQSILRQSWSGTNIEKMMKAQTGADVSPVTNMGDATTREGGAGSQNPGGHPSF